MGKEVWFKVYRTWVCSWCRRHLADGDKLYYHPSMEEFHFCENCKDLIENPPDFDEKGTKEKGTTSWRTAHNLTLHRDDCHCRVCGEHCRREVLFPTKGKAHERGAGEADDSPRLC